MTPRRKGAECSWGREKVGLQRTQEGTTGSADEDLFLEGANSPLSSQKRKEKPAVNYNEPRIPSALSKWLGDRETAYTLGRIQSDLQNPQANSLSTVLHQHQQTLQISRRCVFFPATKEHLLRFSLGIGVII